MELLVFNAALYILQCNQKNNQWKNIHHLTIIRVNNEQWCTGTNFLFSVEHMDDEFKQ